MKVFCKKFCLLMALSFLVVLLTSSVAYAGLCSTPEIIDQGEAKKLIVVIPATSHTREQWTSFYAEFKRQPEASSYAWLFINHEIDFISLGHVRPIAQSISTCINQVVANGNYESISLVGHSIGGMLARRAYLESAGQFTDYAKASTHWTDKVDRILLFASVNRGIPPDAHWMSPFINWTLRTLPHPRFILEDMSYGSDFIIDTRIAWVRYFAKLKHQHVQVPRVVQFWGDQDSIVTENDNADLEAFSGKVLERVADAKHGDLIRLENEFTNAPQQRWKMFEEELFADIPVVPSAVEIGDDNNTQRILIILNGIRDSSNSEWVSDLKARAVEYYGEGNVEAPEYGYFTAAHFAFSPLRQKNVPKFRDLYAQLAAQNPLAEFDFIGHSNGTYILANSLKTTPSMVFNNVSLVAPVVSDSFDWGSIFKRGQVESLRYDVATKDWPVGILCAALSALGSSELGPSGVTLFKGNSQAMASLSLQKVGWYNGGHSAALVPENREHLLKFVETGNYFAAGLPLKNEVVGMRIISNATKYIVWVGLLGLLFWVFKGGKMAAFKRLGGVGSILIIMYIILDII